MALDSVVSDTFGKSATTITDDFTSDKLSDPDNCISLSQRYLKKKAKKDMEFIEDYAIIDKQKVCIKIIRKHFNFIEKLITNVDICVDEMVKKRRRDQSSYTIPSFDGNSVIAIISEIGTDMRFGSSKLLCYWAELNPGNNESTGKKKSIRISRAGMHLKPALVQVADQRILTMF